MNFNEANTVEAFIRDLLCGGVTGITPPSALASLVSNNQLCRPRLALLSLTMTFRANPRKHSSRITFARHSSG